MVKPLLPFESTLKKSIDIGNYTWKNRRRMAWGFFWSMMITTLLAIFWIDNEKLKALETVITWFYMCASSVIGAYMGFSTYASMNSDNSMYSGGYGGERPQEMMDEALFDPESDEAFFQPVKASPDKKTRAIKAKAAATVKAAKATAVAVGASKPSSNVGTPEIKIPSGE